jgi:hypothetical protein
MTYRFSPIGLTEFMYQRDFRMTTPFDTYPHYVQYLLPNILSFAPVFQERIKSGIVELYHMIFKKKEVNPNMLGLSLYKKMMRLNHSDRLEYIFRHIPVFSTVCANNIPDTFYSNLYPQRQIIDISSSMNREDTEIMYHFIENSVHLSFHVFGDIFLHAVLDSNINEFADIRKVVVKFGYLLDDVVFTADSVAHADHNSYISTINGARFDKTWTTMKYEFIPNLFFYLDYFNNSSLPIFKLIDEFSEKIVDELYYETEIDTSNLLNVIRNKFTKYGIKFTDKQMNGRFLFKLYFYTQLLHGHFHNHLQFTISAIGYELAYNTYTGGYQPVIILPMNQNMLSETLPHKKARLDKIYNNFVLSLESIKNSVDIDLQFLYDIDNLTWNMSS